ncbi:MAG: ATPase [Actinomycetota bacterium]|nr:ATPase [Actinomycetota bacterium]MDQ2956531.1 ATPase [Actinomycetota bacterium]
MADYVIAADGGNSKTDAVLATVDGEVLAQVQARGTRPHAEGIERTAADLAELVGLATKQAGLIDPAIKVGAFYLANIDLPAEEEQAHRVLHRLGIAEQIRVYNDVFAVLRAGSVRGWGVAVTSGAGVNAIGVHPDGEVARFLSLGDFTGDWGGGHAVGVAGLGAAIRAGDGRGPDTKLTTQVAEHFSLADAESVALAVHRGELSYLSLHTLAPVVFASASEGDEVARAIVLRLADELANMAATLLRRLRLLDSDADVVLGGGTLQSGNRILLDRIHQLLDAVAPRVTVRVLEVAPVTGALIEALVAAGASPQAQARARAQLAGR